MFDKIKDDLLYLKEIGRLYDAEVSLACFDNFINLPILNVRFIGPELMLEFDYGNMLYLTPYDIYTKEVNRYYIQQHETQLCMYLEIK